MAIEIGSKGLAEVNLTIPQGASLAFTIVHKDEEGHVIDHTSSTIHMAFQSKDGTRTIELSQYCEGADSGIVVSIPASFTDELPKGKMLWDMFAAIDGGPTLRVAYGSVSIVDTYALDGE